MGLPFLIKSKYNSHQARNGDNNYEEDYYQ